MIEFGQEVCGDLAQASPREWLETNGMGGFASSTLTGLNTRRYHGLLVAATKPPVGRALLLSKLEETLVVGERRTELGTNQYPGVIHPQGFSHLKRFRLDPYPIFTFEVDGVVLEKHLCMLHGENTTVIEYRLLSQPLSHIQLEVRPLIAFRDYHATTHENGDLNRNVEQSRGLASVTPYSGMPTLHLAHNADLVEPHGDWYRAFEYERERERGLDYQEDLFSPLSLRFELNNKVSATAIASTEIHQASEAMDALRREVIRRQGLVAAGGEHEVERELTLAADQFIVNRGEQKTVIAGYHWFGDWGRDAMIALPGLTLSTGRFDDARLILREFAKYVDQGMLPNRFPDAGEKPEYNTVDATSWYFEAIRAYHSQTGDDLLLKEIFPVLVEIIDWHVKGTRYGIHVERETALLHAGEPGVQLTWMDAKVGDWVVTPRIGKPVEIQALWYNALRAMEGFAAKLGNGDARSRFGSMATLAASSFNETFWNEEASCLFDVVGENDDPSMRPNQIFAVSLHYSMLSPDRAKKVVAAVRRELLTPVGLRTLSTADPRYIGRYRGDQRSRDACYHQGTVWPWLMGPFIEAYLKVNGADPKSRSQALIWLAGLIDHLRMAGLGTISEIFDGDAPHDPCGCIAQAWSVSEVLRVYKMLRAESDATIAPKNV